MPILPETEYAYVHHHPCIIQPHFSIVSGVPRGGQGGHVPRAPFLVGTNQLAHLCQREVNVSSVHDCVGLLMQNVSK